jgi:large subunit ribosomal protein L19
MSNVLEMVRTSQLKTDLPDINPGDTVRVHARIREGNKERIQVFEGTVIRVRKNAVDASVTVRRISHQVGVERTFLLHSPRVDRFEVVRRGDVRRAALYYLRKRTGKATRIKEKRPPQQQTARQHASPAPAAPAQTAGQQG